MVFESVLLTGGGSRRMGQDKAKLVVNEETLGDRTARLLSKVSSLVTVLGREPIASYGFLKDQGDFKGPLAALAWFQPRENFIFVCACDLPNFDPSIIQILFDRIVNHPNLLASVPEHQGRLQPLCALYRAEAFEVLRYIHAQGRQRIMDWIELMDIAVLSETQSLESGLDLRALQSVNTPESWAEAIKQKSDDLKVQGQ